MLDLLVGKLFQKFKPKSAYTLLFKLRFADSDKERVEALKAVADNLHVIKKNMYQFLGTVILRDLFFVRHIGCLNSVAQDEIFLETLQKVHMGVFPRFLFAFLVVKSSSSSSDFNYNGYLTELHAVLKARGVPEESLSHILRFRDDQPVTISDDTPRDEFNMVM